MSGRRGPTLRSQWLGRLLNEARAEGGKTLRDAAAYLAIDVSTMSRYEGGRIPAKPQHVDSLLDLYGISEVRRRDSLIELSREAWRHDWWDAYEGEVAQQIIDYAWLEDRATMIRSFDTMTVMGLVQTPEFAEVVARADDPDSDDHRIARGVRFRMERQRVFRKEPPPDVSIVLDECVLHRPIGGPGIMSAQLRHLADLMRSGTVELRVLPYAAGAHGGQGGAFKIFDLPGPFPQVGYAETIAGSTFVESGDIHRFVRTYERLREAAFDPGRSAELITAAAREMR